MVATVNIVLDRPSIVELERKDGHVPSDMEKTRRTVFIPDVRRPDSIISEPNTIFNGSEPSVHDLDVL